MYSTLVLCDDLVSCMMLESYLKKSGLTNICQSNSLDKISRELKSGTVRYLYIDLSSSFERISELQDLLDNNVSTQIIFLGTQILSSLDIRNISPSPLILSRTPGFEADESKPVQKTPACA